MAAHGCPSLSPAVTTSEQDGETPVAPGLLCPFTSLISPSVPLMLELRTFYCPLVFIINEKGPEWSFLKFRESIKTRSRNAILLVLEMCEIILSCGKKKSEGGGEENWVRDTVKALRWPHQHYDVMKNVTALPEIYIQSSFLSVVEGGREVSQLTLTLHIPNFPTRKIEKIFRRSEKALIV